VGATERGASQDQFDCAGERKEKGRRSASVKSLSPTVRWIEEVNGTPLAAWSRVPMGRGGGDEQCSSCLLFSY
jgi:hypothetical protein